MALADLNLPFFEAESAILLYNQDYYHYLLAQIRRARQSILAAQFIMAIYPTADRQREVLTLSHALVEAAWRGVEVRILLSPFRSGDVEVDINRIAAQYLSARNVPVRTFSPLGDSRRRGLHSKYVLIDQRLTLLGSHNWTPGAFNSNFETSIAVESVDLGLRLAQSFNRMWEQSNHDSQPV